jgi:hypothetical protein
MASLNMQEIFSLERNMQESFAVISDSISLVNAY